MTGMHRIDRIKKYPVHPVNSCKKLRRFSKLERYLDLWKSPNIAQAEGDAVLVATDLPPAA